MKIYTLNNLSAKEKKELIKRPLDTTPQTLNRVSKIVKTVKKRGDEAIREYTTRFDKVLLKTLQVSSAEFTKAERKISSNLKQALQIATRNITAFHKTTLQKEKPVETMPGVICFREKRSIQTVGLYIPGGSAPLFSTVLMLAIPAKIAGCQKIILCTPPNTKGQIAPEILYAAKKMGITEVYKVGGAQAIAAMAYGTGSIPKVDKIFGPGNQYVTTAKMLVSTDPEGAAIDMPAGPSEVFIIADNNANPAFVAADLLSQAEHGPDSQALLITLDTNVAERVKIELEKQLSQMPRSDIARASLKKSFILIAQTVEQALKFSNEYAPEHLILNLQNPKQYIPLIQNAGSVFLGQYTPESVGDYASGTNHTLPTSGYARSYSGISTESFLKKITFQELNIKGLKNISKTVTVMANAEGLQGHANAVNIRL